VPDLALPPAVFRRLDDVGIVLAELALRRPSLDEVFLTLTGHPAGPVPGDTDPAGPVPGDTHPAGPVPGGAHPAGPAADPTDLERTSA
jgi:hypothetical protein